MSNKIYSTVADVNNSIPLMSRLTATKFDYRNNKNGKKERYVVCLCMCGAEKKMTVWQATHNISCGCFSRENASIRNRLSLEDIIVEPKYCKNGKTITMVECICDCGVIKIFRAKSIMSKSTFSCGCMHREWFMKLVTKYPNANKGILSSYQAMVSRCTNPNNQAARLYIEKGVKVCNEWLNDLWI